VTTRLPALKPRDVLRALEKAGFVVHHVSRSHYVLKHPERGNRRVTVPWHNRDLKRGTLAAIIEQAGFTASEFIELL
jgi:predicted RNA binding protein YcfA (HicA-like mRNA interferase family)